MAKHRKTREEKIAASLKHQEQKQQEISYSLPSSAPIVSQPVKQTAPAVSVYTKDLQKTFIISSLLIASEIILYFLLHQHVLRIPWTSY